MEFRRVLFRSLGKARLRFVHEFFRLSDRRSGRGLRFKRKTEEKQRKKENEPFHASLRWNYQRETLKLSLGSTTPHIGAGAPTRPSRSLPKIFGKMQSKMTVRGRVLTRSAQRGGLRNITLPSPSLV